MVVQMDKSKSKGYMLTTCHYCGNEFYCQKFRIEKHKHVFCSKKCEFAYKKSQTKLNCTCDFCGKKFHRKQSQINKHKRFNACSKECDRHLRQQLMSGEHNHQYGLKGRANASWKSDERISVYGYRLIRKPEHPFANGDGFVFEHRLIAEENLLNNENSVKIDGKKYLSPDFHVHHCNFNRLDNAVNNLRVLPKGVHMIYHSLLRYFEKHKQNDSRYEDKMEELINISQQYDIPLMIEDDDADGIRNGGFGSTNK